jgi:hypothetical protein
MAYLQPDQWNYVTANLISLSTKTVSRIDIGYDQPGASGNHRGYIDDITLSHRTKKLGSSWADARGPSQRSA